MKNARSNVEVSILMRKRDWNKIINRKFAMVVREGRLKERKNDVDRKDISIEKLLLYRREIFNFPSISWIRLSEEFMVVIFMTRHQKIWYNRDVMTKVPVSFERFEQFTRTILLYSLIRESSFHLPIYTREQSACAITTTPQTPLPTPLLLLSLLYAYMRVYGNIHSANGSASIKSQLIKGKSSSVLVNTIAIAPGESCSIRTFNPSRRLEKFRAERNPNTSTNLDTKSEDFKGDEFRINPQSKLILVDILSPCSHN
ncbi:hypothetical protein V1478_016780 [Vespula squamosa]|uniref:Uncharacterized protein n=1 Tax=Vespula squamosa TaxID=30214 RepID=A0ABD2A0V4_VESSQ